MELENRYFKLAIDNRNLSIGIFGDWIMENAADIETVLTSLDKHVVHCDAIRMHCSGLRTIDTTGAYMLYKRFSDYEKQGIQAKLEGFKEIHFKFVKAVQGLDKHPCPLPFYNRGLLAAMNHIGKSTVEAFDHLLETFTFYGRLFATLATSLTSLKRLRLNSVTRHIQEAGIDALPIVGMMAFLIAIVLTYQGATQLAKFGAEIYTINLNAISITREMGVLLTAILVAGRSGSSFAAEIGVMKMNQEVDALQTLGIDPYEVLVVPRIIALVIALPLMAFLANLCGLAGGALMVVTVLDIPMNLYLEQTLTSITLTDFFVGMVKAPVFAFIIASVGTFRGMQADGSAESVGRLTTISVVQAIFLVIAADALFSILFAELGI